MPFFATPLQLNYSCKIRLLSFKILICISAFSRFLWILPRISRNGAMIDQGKVVKQQKFNVTHSSDMDFRSTQRARICPECSILVLFRSQLGYSGVVKCFPKFPDLFRVSKMVRFEFLQKMSFSGSRSIVNKPYQGGAKKRGQMTQYSTFLAIFHNN